MFLCWHIRSGEKLSGIAFFSLAFIVPALLMILLGYGISLDVENIPFVVVDHDGSAMSREYAHRFIDSRYFDFKRYTRNEHMLTTKAPMNLLSLIQVEP